MINLSILLIYLDEHYLGSQFCLANRPFVYPHMNLIILGVTGKTITYTKICSIPEMLETFEVRSIIGLYNL